MKITIEHHHRLDPAIGDWLERLIQVLIRQQEIIMADLTQLTADVTANTDAVNSAVTLIKGLADEIRKAGTDPAALKALTDKLEANTTALAEAVTANTVSTDS